MDCNIFEQCKWLQHLGKVMILLVIGFVGISVWAVLWDTYYPAFLARSGFHRVPIFLLALLFTSLIAMLLWSYLVTVFTDPGNVPKGWTPFLDEEAAEDDFERLNARETGLERLAGSTRPRYCRKCNAWKPPRAHHDRVLGRCVLKMDHYCVWVINTVGLLNYKAFILFLFYTFLASLMGASSLVGGFVQSLWNNTDLSVLVYIGFAVDLAFTLALAGFLCMHLRLISANCTTIEMFEKKRVPMWPYDKGFKQNFMEVFGYRMVWWLIPVYSKEEKEGLLEGCLGYSTKTLEHMSLKGTTIEL